MAKKLQTQDKARLSREQRHAHLIDAAASLFAVNGFKGTTTRAIAKTAGVSEALLFKYFPTKRVLYAAILEERAPIAELLEVVEEAAKKRDDRRVFTLIAGYRIRRDTDPTLMRLLLFSALEGHELSDMFFQHQHRRFYEYLSSYIAQRVEDGVFQPVDPLLAARAFMGMVAHHRLLHDIFRVPAHRSPEEAVRTYVTLFLDGIRAGVPSRRRSREGSR